MNCSVRPLAMLGLAGVTAIEIKVAGVFVSKKLAGVVTPDAAAATV